MRTRALLVAGALIARSMFVGKVIVRGVTA